MLRLCFFHTEYIPSLSLPLHLETHGHSGVHTDGVWMNLSISLLDLAHMEMCFLTEECELQWINWGGVCTDMTKQLWEECEHTHEWMQDVCRMYLFCTSAATLVCVHNSVCICVCATVLLFCVCIHYLLCWELICVCVDTSTCVYRMRLASDPDGPALGKRERESGRQG